MKFLGISIVFLEINLFTVKREDFLYVDGYYLYNTLVNNNILEIYYCMYILIYYLSVLVTMFFLCTIIKYSLYCTIFVKHILHYGRLGIDYFKKHGLSLLCYKIVICIT